ncbi:MAG: hypothetical protein CMQ54_01795 [Gammaproteobacteria bacterium]|nr:hypothetical protein [Gammaproteobacteria bacterium]
MKAILQIPIFCILLCFMGLALAQNQNIPIIFDTDFGMPPTDDALALMLAVQSPEIDILGITTVAGNNSLEQGTSDVLRMLEIIKRTDIPVFEGENLPLEHRVSEFAIKEYGSWYSDEAPSKPYGGFAKKKIEKISAAKFIEQKVLANPEKITIVALGPLTNIAMAILDNPQLSKKIKKIFIMGGAIASLPDGSGNITPNAEYNFWVDPEAAKIVLRSGIPVELSPLNVSRQSSFSKENYEKIIEVKSPLTELIKLSLGPRFLEDPHEKFLMYDQIAIASVIDPLIVKSKRMFVDVNDNKAISYGVSIGGFKKWPGAEEAQLIDVQYDLDWPRFIEIYVERLRQPLSN